MADDVTLLPCKCGTRPEVSQEPYTRRVAILCAGCGEVTRFYDTASEAYDAWNEARRNDAVAERDARIAALEAQLAEARDCIDLFNRSIVRAECKWKEQHPDSAFYPDVPDLILWLKEQVDTLAERRCETCDEWDTIEDCGLMGLGYCQDTNQRDKDDGCSRWWPKGAPRDEEAADA